MKYGSLILEKKEYVLLKRIMNVSYHSDDSLVKNSIKKLNEELLTAMICNEDEMPTDVIRFHSKVTVSSGAWEKEFELVSPANSDFKKNRISVMTPMGSAVIGYSEGDSIHWDFPTGTKELLIKSVKQADKLIDADIMI